MVTEPWVSTLVLDWTESDSRKWTLLGGFDSTMHTHFDLSPSEEQAETVLISGASARKGNVESYGPPTHSQNPM